MRNHKVDLVLKIVTLIAITNVTLFIKGTVATLVIDIQVILILGRATSTIENLGARRLLT